MTAAKVNPLSRKTIFPLLRKLFKVTYSGLENVSNEKNYIFAMNHPGGPDLLLATAILVPRTNRHLSIFLHREVYDFPLLKTLFKRWQAVRVEPKDESKRRESIEEGARLLQKGNNVLIFPEALYGGKMIKGPLRARTGVIRLAIKAKRTIIPVGISGSYEAWKFPHTFPKNPLSVLYFNFSKPITIRFGKEISLEEHYGLDITKKSESTRLLLRRLVTKLMIRIAELAGEKYAHDAEHIS